MDKEKTSIFKKWWFWVCIVLIVCVVGGVCIALYITNNETIVTSSNLTKKVEVGKLTYYIDNNWENTANTNENITYKYHYPNNDTMLMVMVENNNIYKSTDSMDIILNSYVHGLKLNNNDFISKNTKKINNYNCGVVRCFVNEYETVQYIIVNDNEAYVFWFGQKNKLNNKYVELIENIISKAEIIKETEEEKQKRLQKEAEEKAQKEQEEKAQKEQEAKQKEQDKKNFIANCKTYTYEQMARNPENFKGTNVKLTGEVVQALYGSNSVDLRVNITKKGNYSTYYTDTVYVVYYPETGEDKILENDIITIYGTSMGDYSYTSTMGAKITLPLISGKYITINK